MGVRWLIGVVAFWILLTSVGSFSPKLVIPIAALFLAWAVLGAYLDAERWRARARRYT